MNQPNRIFIDYGTNRWFYESNNSLAYINKHEIDLKKYIQLVPKNKEDKTLCKFFRIYQFASRKMNTFSR